MTLIAVIEGDGIGREVIPAALTVLERTGLDLALEPFDAGAERYSRTGTAIPDDMMDDLARADAIALGAIGGPRVTDPGYTAGTSVERAAGEAVRARECTADIGGRLSIAEAAAAIARRV